MRRVVTCAAIAAFVSLGSSGQAAVTRTFDQGSVHVVTSDDPKRIDWEIVVPASLDAVWTAFTTSAGMITWVAPAASVDLRAGGEWTVNFPGAAPGGGTIVVYQPKTLLAIDAMAPESFPTVRRERTLAVFTFTSLGANQTGVHLA